MVKFPERDVHHHWYEDTCMCGLFIWEHYGSVRAMEADPRGHRIISAEFTETSHG